MTRSAGATVKERDTELVAAVPGVESVALMVTEAVPEALGVPEICPVLALMLSPEGSPVADHAYGVLPPLALAVVE